jgi:hypothetical protein
MPVNPFFGISCLFVFLLQKRKTVHGTLFQSVCFQKGRLGRPSPIKEYPFAPACANGYSTLVVYGAIRLNRKEFGEVYFEAFYCGVNL